MSPAPLNQPTHKHIVKLLQYNDIVEKDDWYAVKENGSTKYIGMLDRIYTYSRCILSHRDDHIFMFKSLT